MFEGPRVADDLSNGASLQIVPKSEDRIRESNEQESGREERKEDFDAHRLSIQDLDSAFLLPVPSLSLPASSHTSMSHQWDLLASCGGLPLCSATFPVAFPHILMSKEISDSHHLQVFICHARGLHFGPENADTRADVRPSLKTHRRAQVGRASPGFDVAFPTSWAPPSLRRPACGGTAREEGRRLPRPSRSVPRPARYPCT